MPWRSVLLSYSTSWSNQNLSKRFLKVLTVSLEDELKGMKKTSVSRIIWCQRPFRSLVLRRTLCHRIIIPDSEQERTTKARTERKLAVTHGLAISNAKISIYFSNKIHGSNFIKQHSETVMVWSYQMLIAVWEKNIVSFMRIFDTLSFPISFQTRTGFQTSVDILFR